MSRNSIFVTKTFLPNLEEYIDKVKLAFDSNQLTNRGALVLDLEKKLQNVLQLESSYILLTSSATISLQIALKLFGKSGEIITTPFSYVATTASIVWENCIPIFVDIDSKYLTIDETKIEAAITENTTCILATHVYGNPCNVIEIERIAQKYNLKVIYDSAHCFNVKYKGKSIFEWGDLSICSFHATKIFHTGEGGAIFCKDEALYEEVFYAHNFGHKGVKNFHNLGINGKMSELHAAMGLSILPYIKDIIEKREILVTTYKILLFNLNIRFLEIRLDTKWNYSYFPVIFENEAVLLKVEKVLNENQVFPRRYFYPSLNKLNFINFVNTPISENISKTILCLPLYHDLQIFEIKKIVNLLKVSLC